MKVLMECGHTSNTKFDDKPACVICFPKEEAMRISSENPDLRNRIAKCIYCPKTMTSETAWEENAAFFSYRPDKPVDTYYCGCEGWD